MTLIQQEISSWSDATLRAAFYECVALREGGDLKPGVVRDYLLKLTEFKERTSAIEQDLLFRFTGQIIVAEVYYQILMREL